MVIRLPHMPGEGPVAAGSGRRGNKFGAKRTTCGHGHTHDSKAEALRCDDLRLLERAGHIRKLEQHPVFHFTTADGRQVRSLMRGARSGGPIRYTADFGYEERQKSGEWRKIVEDVKSLATMTEAAVLRLAFFQHFHPELELRLTR